MLLRWMFVCAALAGSVFSAIWARAAYLFGQNTRESVAAAVRLVPYNAQYLAWLAHLEPDRKTELLKRALALNPYDSQSWVQLGLDAELRAHDIAGAERYYKQAAQVDRTYLPKWTLTNFYFRQGNEPEFFRWATKTLQMTPNSPDPVFDQMWAVSQDQSRIADAVPNRTDLLINYASYLNNRGRWAAISPIVDRIITDTSIDGAIPPGRDDVLGPIEDRLQREGHFEEALHIWSSMSRAHWIGFGVPSASNPVTNGNFDQPAFHHGFDWIPAGSSGVRITDLPKSKEIQFKFDGSEPDSSLLLSQYVPLEKNRSYRLEWKATSKELSRPGGITWSLGFKKGERVSRDVTEQNTGTWDFDAPSDRDFGQLQLRYSRPPGTTLALGIFTLQSVSLRER